MILQAMNNKSSLDARLCQTNTLCYEIRIMQLKDFVIYKDGNDNNINNSTTYEYMFFSLHVL